MFSFVHMVRGRGEESEPRGACRREREREMGRGEEKERERDESTVGREVTFIDPRRTKQNQQRTEPQPIRGWSKRRLHASAES